MYYCSNCGRGNDDGAVFCAHCGKSPTEEAVKDKDTKVATGFTVELIRTCFPWMFAFMFWLTVIGGMIGGAKVAQGLYPRNYDDEIGTLVVGGLIGLVVGFITAVWANGVVATLLKMDRNLQYLADKEKAKV